MDIIFIFYILSKVLNLLAFKHMRVCEKMG